MAFNGYHHIGLYTADIDKSLAFYRDGLGGNVTLSFPMGDSGKTIYLVDIGGGAVVELIPKGEGKAEADPHWVHIAVATDDAQDAFAKAVAAGAKVQSEPHALKLGDMQGYNAFVKGPDDEVVEFFQVD